MQLHRDIEQIHAAGAQLVIIGNGAPMFIAGFREHTGYTGPLYTDPSLAVFAAAELRRGVIRTLNLRAALPTVRAMARGAKQGRTRGDPYQQGGALVIAPDGEIKWHHISDYPGDNATTGQILEALR